MFKKMNLLLTVVALGMLLIMPANAHTPILYVDDYGDGTIFLEGGFSDGSSAAGVEILLVEKAPFEGDTKIRDRYIWLIFTNEYFKNLRDDFIESTRMEDNKTVVFTEDSQKADFGAIKAELYQEKHLIIFRIALDEYSLLTLPKPDTDYFVVFNAGPGHIVERDGPVLTEEERSFLGE